MNQVFRSAGVVVVGVGFFAWSQMQSEQNFDRMAAHYNLNPAQIEFAESCMSSLSYHDKEFKGGAKSYTGCGCIASTLASGEQAVDYTKMSRAFGSVVKFSETDSGKDIDAIGLMQELTGTHGLDYGETMTVIAELGRATDECKSAKLPKASMQQASNSSAPAAPHQPIVTDVPSSGTGCSGLSADSIETLQKIADRDGETLEEICARVVS